MTFCPTHYSFDCGCPPPVTPLTPSLPPYVWVVVEMYTKSVQVGRAAATDPIQGRMSIFQKPEVTQQVAGRIVGVFTSRDAAVACINPREGSEYLIECHEIEDGVKQVAPPVVVEQKCALCGAPAATTFCRRCDQERLAKLRELNGEAIVKENGPKSTFVFIHPLPDLSNVPQS